MDVKSFLKNFLKFGIDNGYFKLLAVKDIPKVCCPESDIEAIDFDQTKEGICKEFKRSSLKSCDALKIIPERQRIDFIEFKGFKNFIANNSNIDERKVKKQIEGLNLSGKIIDSNHLLEILLSKRHDTTVSEKKFYYQVEKNYIIVTDLDDGIENFMLTLDFLSEVSEPYSIERTIVDKLGREVNSLPGSELHNIKPPMLKSCRSFDTFYQKEGIC
jgi:hypothetical protein